MSSKAKKRTQQIKEIKHAQLSETCTLPSAPFDRIVKNYLPEEYRLANDASQTLRLVTEDVLTELFNTAGEHCYENGRVTVNTSDFNWARKCSGFGHMQQEEQDCVASIASRVDDMCSE